MTSQERNKALLVEWLVKFGKDWTPAGQVIYSNMRDEVGRAERLNLIEYRYAPNMDRKTVYEYRLTKKALNLLGIEEDA